VKPPEWVADETVRALHDQLLAAFGGSAGVRDEGLLASALARPRSKVDCASPDVFDLAAAYAFGVIKNHPFVDGNKRTGFACAIVFLESNGQIFAANEADALVETFALAAGERTEVAYAEWLRRNSRRRSARTRSMAVSATRW
jgi:death on curing protein